MPSPSVVYYDAADTGPIFAVPSSTTPPHTSSSRTKKQQRRRHHNKEGRVAKKTWANVLSSTLCEDEKSTIRESIDNLEDKRGSKIKNIIEGDKLWIQHIITSSNYLGSNDLRTRNFLSISINELETNNHHHTKERIAKQWDTLKGVAVVECISNTHYHSVFLQPGKMREPIIGYDSKKNYSSSRDDVIGDACSDLNDLGNHADEKWRQIVGVGKK